MISCFSVGLLLLNSNSIEIQTPGFGRAFHFAKEHLLSPQEQEL